MLGKALFTKQTGPGGKIVNRLYIENGVAIGKEFYLSCLIDRETSTVTFIASSEGGMDIEEVAQKNPEKIITAHTIPPQATAVTSGVGSQRPLISRAIR